MKTFLARISKASVVVMLSISSTIMYSSSHAGVSDNDDIYVACPDNAPLSLTDVEDLLLNSQLVAEPNFEMESEAINLNHDDSFSRAAKQKATLKIVNNCNNHSAQNYINGKNFGSCLAYGKTYVGKVNAGTVTHSGHECPTGSLYWPDKQITLKANTTFTLTLTCN